VKLNILNIEKSIINSAGRCSPAVDAAQDRSGAFIREVNGAAVRLSSEHG
jgi:hypothetical protein